jgi:hypothetical protein
LLRVSAVAGRAIAVREVQIFFASDLRNRLYLKVSVQTALGYSELRFGYALIPYAVRIDVSKNEVGKHGKNI